MGLLRITARGPISLGEVGYSFLSSFPLYVQARLYRRQEQIRKLYDAYALLLGAAVNFLQATMLICVPLLLGVALLVFIPSWLTVGSASAVELMVASGTILIGLITLAIGVSVCGLAVGVGVAVYREISHYICRI